MATLGQFTPGTKIILSPADPAHPLAGASATVTRQLAPGDYGDSDLSWCPCAFPSGALRAVLDSTVPWKFRSITVGPEHARLAPVLVQE